MGGSRSKARLLPAVSPLPSASRGHSHHVDVECRDGPTIHADDAALDPALDSALLLRASHRALAGQSSTDILKRLVADPIFSTDPRGLWSPGHFGQMQIRSAASCRPSVFFSWDEAKLPPPS